VVARRAFETVFRAMVDVLQRSIADKNRASRVNAQVIAALSIGGMVVARTLVDRAHGDELRSACLAVALQLGGWDKRAVRRRGGLHRASPRSKTS
jgi:TetR/AcrR family transcriptional regulator, transcriptional repressor for nem operon